jgi:DnaJ homolog subfamily C member 9
MPVAKTDQEKSLYDILDVPSSATDAEIKKAYYRLALTLHPDKNPGVATAADKFQTLQLVYATLHDAEKRELYDRTGAWEGSKDSSIDEQLVSYFRGLFKKVSSCLVHTASLVKPSLSSLHTGLSRGRRTL